MSKNEIQQIIDLLRLFGVFVILVVSGVFVV